MRHKNIARRHAAFSLLVLSAVVASLLWPGDAFWSGNEQASIIDQALQANVTHRLSSYHGGGSTAAIPHPFTVWVYQLFLLVTHDLVKIIFIKQFIVLCVCLSGLFYLRKALKYNKYVILIFLFSFCHYTLSRQIEDSSFLVMFSLLLFVFYAWFYTRKGYAPLLCLAVCLIALIHCSHRGLITAVPFVITFFVFEYHWLKKHWRGVLLVFLGALLVSAPYLLNTFQRFLEKGLAASDPVSGRTASLSFWFTIVSGGLWYSYDFLQLVSDTCFRRCHVSPGVARMLIGATMTGYLFLVSGMGLTILGLAERIRRSETFTLEDRFGVLSLLTILVYIVLLNIFHLFNHWIYHSGLWFCSFYFIWRAVTTYQHKRLIKYMFPAYLTTMFILWLGCLIVIHVNSDRLFTIKAATELAEKISAYSPESDIVLLVDWAEDCEEITNIIVANSDYAFLGFFYRKYGLSLKSSCRALRKLNINRFYNALKPLVYIQRQGMDDILPARTLVIKNDDRPGKMGVVLVDDPNEVRVDLNKRPAGVQGELWDGFYQ